MHLVLATTGQQPVLAEAESTVLVVVVGWSVPITCWRIRRGLSNTITITEEDMYVKAAKMFEVKVSLN